ncbi:hypothetical protein BH11PSE11_BH11PSE11_24420 [soil metagenome]
MQQSFDFGSDKLRILFFLLLFLMLTVGIAAVLQVEALSASSNTLAAARISKLRTLLQMNADLRQLSLAAGNHSNIDSRPEGPGAEAAVSAALAEFHSRQELFASQASGTEEKRISQQLRSLRTRYEVLHENLVDQLARGGSREAQLQAKSTLDALAAEMRHRLDELAATGLPENADFSRSGRELRHASAILIACLIVGSILIGFGAFAMQQNFRRELERSKQLTLSKQAEESMHQSELALHRFVAHQQQESEDERKRIAAEIHDDLGQNLLALRMDVALLHTRSGDGTRLNKKAHLALHTIDTAIKSVRGIISELRPIVLNLGLPAAVEWQLSEFKRSTGIDYKLTIDEREFDLKLDDDRTVVVFRILQETLANVARHAQASSIEVELGIDNGVLLMTVRDNGKGFRPIERRKANAFGLIGINERVNALKGKLTIDSSNGTVIAITIPLGPTRTEEA